METEFDRIINEVDVLKEEWGNGDKFSVSFEDQDKKTALLMYEAAVHTSELQKLQQEAIIFKHIVDALNAFGEDKIRCISFDSKNELGLFVTVLTDVLMEKIIAFHFRTKKKFPWL